MDQPESHEEPLGAGEDAHGRDRQQEGMRMRSEVELGGGAGGEWRREQGGGRE